MCLLLYKKIMYLIFYDFYYYKVIGNPGNYKLGIKLITFGNYHIINDKK